jgi:predicted nucleic acid-binding protein
MIVVADTSPLANLAAIGQLDLLRQLYQQVVIPEAVASEIRAGETRGTHPEFLDTVEWIEVRRVSDQHIVAELVSELDLGEAEAIALSLELHADLVLIDERAGRIAAAQRGIRTIGLLGTLIACKSRGFIPAVRPVLDDLRTRAGFWVSQELYDLVVRQAGEDG